MVRNELYPSQALSTKQKSIEKLKMSGTTRTVGDSRTGPCNPDPTRVMGPYFA